MGKEQQLQNNPRFYSDDRIYVYVLQSEYVI